MRLAFVGAAAARWWPADRADGLAARGDSAEARQTMDTRRAAIALRLDAAALYRRAGMRREEGRVLGAVGRTYSFISVPDSALHHLADALAASRAAGDRNAEAASLGVAGFVHANAGRPDSALRYYDQAVSLARAVGDSTVQAERLIGIGGAYSDLGRPDSALAYYRRARRLARATGQRALEGWARGAAGSLLAALGRRDAAMTEFRESLAIGRELGDRTLEAWALCRVGNLFGALGRTDSALVYHHRALPMTRAVGDRRTEGVVLANLGAVFARLRRPDSALHYQLQALALARAARDQRTEAAALANVAANQSAVGRPDSALHYQQLALALRRAIGDRRGESITLRGIARLHLEPRSGGERDVERGLAYLDSAAAVAAAMRRVAGADVNAISLAETNRGLYASWALAWLSRADAVGADASARAALAVAERGRAQALRDLVRTSAGRRAPQVADDAETRPGVDPVAEADRLLAPLRRSGTSTLAYLVTPDTLIAWLALPSGEVHVARLAYRLDSLDLLVRAARAGLDPTLEDGTTGRGRAARTLSALDSEGNAPPPLPPGATRGALGRLARLLLPAELRARLPAGGDLLVVPHGALALVPFGALPLGDGGEPLGARHALRLAPSLAALPELESRPAPPVLAVRGGGGGRGGALVIGNPLMPALPGASRAGAPSGLAATLDALPGAEREARWLAARLGTRALTGRSAAESAVRARLPHAALIHFATHGFAFGSDARARDSFVALAPDAGSDGLLTVGEVLDDPSLTLTADLVVLSACQTGLGHVRQAEGVVGLSRAFLARGARSVLVSLWSVSDAATELLMRRFYGHWLDDADGPSKAEALRRAQQDVRRTPRFAHPRYWAGFQLVGAR
jgi:tetratricopeptide (TPR) repeat protein